MSGRGNVDADFRSVPLLFDRSSTGGSELSLGPGPIILLPSLDRFRIDESGLSTGKLDSFSYYGGLVGVVILIIF